MAKMNKKDYELHLAAERAEMGLDPDTGESLDLNFGFIHFNPAKHRRNPGWEDRLYSCSVFTVFA